MDFDPNNIVDFCLAIFLFGFFEITTTNSKSIMKTFNKIVFFAVLLVSGLAFQKCKDNILTPVANTKSADSLVALISALNTQLVILGEKDKTLQIQLAKFQSKADSLNAISDYN